MTDISAYIVQLQKEGLSLNATAQRLNAEGYKTVRGKEYTAMQVGRILKQAYGGELPFTLKKGRVPGYISTRRKFPQRSKIVRVPEDWDVEAVYASLTKLEQVLEEWQNMVKSNANPNQPRLKKVTELLNEMRQAMPKKASDGQPD